MRHRLFIAFVTVVLTLAGWAGALASVVCAHAGGGAEAAGQGHACRRAKAGSQTQQRPAQTSAPTSTRYKMPGGRDCHTKNSGGHGAKHDAAGGHSATHQTEEPRAAAGRRAGVARANTPCAHCLSRPEPPPATARVRDREGPRREAGEPDARVQSVPSVVELARVPAVAAARGAPPGTTRRHVLLNLFLI